MLFEALPVYFQYVNEQATHVKIDHVSRQCPPCQQLISNFSCCRMGFNYWSFMNENQKALKYKEDILVFL